MKNMRALTGLVILLVMALATFAPLASAYDPTIKVAANGKNWSVSIRDIPEITVENPIVDVECGWLDFSTPPVYSILPVKSISIMTFKVVVKFNPEQLPVVDADGNTPVDKTGMILTLADGTLLIYSGPGFTSAFRPR